MNQQQQLSAAYHRYLIGTYAPAPQVMVEGKGAILVDRRGKKYVDFTSGVAVTSLGHGFKPLTDAIGLQASRLMHVSNLFVNDNLVRVARQVVLATGMEQVFFCNSGTEANECALKLARKRGAALAAHKTDVVSLVGSFHGRCGLSLAASGQPRLWEDFGPLASGFSYVPHDDPRAIRKAFNRSVCAAIIEPIQGESGLRPVSQSVLKLIKQQCDRHNALLIVDEVQTGMGRTGSLLCSPQNLKPDVVTLGKGLGGGFPVAATVVSGKATDVLQPGDHGSTYGGNPLALVAVEEVLAWINRPSFLRRVKTKGREMRAYLTQLKKNTPIAEIRGAGMLLGIKLDGIDCKTVAQLAWQQGLLTAPAGDNVLRLMPPLNITRVEMDLGLHRLAKVLLKL